MRFHPREGSEVQTSCLETPKDVDDRPDLRENEYGHSLERMLHDPFNLLDSKSLLTLQGVCSIRFRGGDGFQLDPAIITADCF